MFVMSVKASTIKVTAALAALAIVIAAAFWEGGIARTAVDSPEAEGAGAVVSSLLGSTSNVDVSSNEKRVFYLKKLGWQVSDNPSEIVEITIPQKFNAVYDNYNAIQKAQGYDLSKYRGARAKRFTYAVSNYPDEKVGVCANLLVYNGGLSAATFQASRLTGLCRGFP